MRASSIVLSLLLAACTAPVPGQAGAAPWSRVRFEGVDAAGRETTFALDAWGGSDGLLLVVVSGGAWCGTCLWPAQHASTLLDEALRARVTRVDLVVGDRDNAPADARAASAWQAMLDVDGIAVGADPGFVLGALASGSRLALPLYVAVDRRTMTPVGVLPGAAPSALRDALRAALARIDGTPPPPREDEVLVDGVFHEDEWALLQTISVPGAPPPDPTNRVADDPEAAALGRALFTDPGLSASGEMACATCHQASMAMSDGRARALGAAEGTRRTPSIALAAHARWLFWDGRADSGWAQALGPLESPREMASSRTAVARRVIEAHGEAYRAIFGALPDVRGWPATGMPGDAVFDGLDAATRDAITEVFVNAGKAIAAYERTFRVEQTPLDLYVAGDRGALDAEQRYGLELFVRSGCMQCHWGPRLTDDAFHVVGMPGAAGDGGRLDGVHAWAASEFRGDGRWSDAPSRRTVTMDDALRGQFRTPSLRGVADEAFFGHAGAFSALSGVMGMYGSGVDGAVEGTREPWVEHFGETTAWGLLPLLRQLRARVGE